MKMINYLVAGMILTIGTLGLETVTFASTAAEHCGVGDVTPIKYVAPQGYSQIAVGHLTPGLPDALQRCQARLYDDNGPETPHVWCEQDLFLLGILIFDSYKYLGLDRETVAASMEQFSHQVFWSSLTETTEIGLTRTATRDLVHPFLGHLVVYHDYAIMGEQPFSPGFYIWEWIQRHPIAVEPGNPEGITVIFSGEVEIVSHEDHVSRVEAGTW